MDMHDTVAQDLSGLRFLVEQARRQAVPGPGRGQGASSHTLETIASVVDSVLSQTRGLIATTMPVSVESTLRDAVNRIATRFSRETGIEVEVDVDVGDVKLTRETEVVFVRCLQEGLSNVRQHAQATKVMVSIGLPGERALLTLTDNGVGMADTDPDAGFGLPGMKTRVELAGGNFSVSSPGLGEGTIIEIRMPVRRT
jgi:signal transduction histidine kinase